MRLTAIHVQEGGVLTLETDPSPSKEWLDDGLIRWLNVEGATRADLEQLFDRLGAEGSVLAEHITGEDWLEWIEREQFYVRADVAPTSWREHETWFHFVVLPETIVTVHGVEIPAMREFIQRWWLDRPGPDAATEAVLLHVIGCYVDEESSEFNRLRLQIVQHAEGLRRGNAAFTVEHLEALMTKCHHMTAVLFEHQSHLEAVDFLRSRVISRETQTKLFRRGAQAIRSMRERLEHVQHRLQELQRQHLMDQQELTASRMRVLTVVSVIFLPLTLIAGIYGMNFQNMPELDERYAYYIVVSVMVLLGVGMLTLFYRRGWFRR